MKLINKNAKHCTIQVTSKELEAITTGMGEFLYSIEELPGNTWSDVKRAYSKLLNIQYREQEDV